MPWRDLTARRLCSRPWLMAPAGATVQPQTEGNFCRGDQFPTQPRILLNRSMGGSLPQDRQSIDGPVSELLRRLQSPPRYVAMVKNQVILFRTRGARRARNLGQNCCSGAEQKPCCTVIIRQTRSRTVADLRGKEKFHISGLLSQCGRVHASPVRNRLYYRADNSDALPRIPT